jgi:hypothetical protein
VTTLVRVHFTRTLVRTALDHVERLGTDAERQAVDRQMAVLYDADAATGS